MIISNAPIRCINMNKSTDRMFHVLLTFNEVKCINAIDGMQFSNNTFDEYKRPNWDNRKYPIDSKYFYIFPTTYACNLSHMKAWIDFIDSKDEWSIIVEDDTEPVMDLSNISIPDNCDFYYLIGVDHPGKRLFLYDDGQVKFSRTLGAYLLSKKAAILALEAMKPIHYFQADWQVPFRIFESMKNCKIPQPNWDNKLPTIKAYGQRESIIKHSQFAKVSTFTKDGSKSWIPNSLL